MRIEVPFRRSTALYSAVQIMIDLEKHPKEFYTRVVNSNSKSGTKHAWCVVQCSMRHTKLLGGMRQLEYEGGASCGKHLLRPPHYSKITKRFGTCPQRAKRL
uniref:Uncharacterized protein n=1 Tax=Octactis speculum TaxID=3111310 RepID=A0A7S2CAW7_9STRA|mmetsp:Transcript_33740/g.45614  ORF Transcript_33740/g.45614 Transcript_33740/m.45614 type:complete len:102 (+) Transcript_33740:119-424(+)